RYDRPVCIDMAIDRLVAIGNVTVGYRPLSPMSSCVADLNLDRGLGVGQHGAVDDVGEPAFERADGFLAGRSLLGAALEVGDGVGVGSRLSQGDAVDGGVELAVAGPAEAVSLVVA